MRLDGVLDEPAWAEADSIAGLTQVEPRQGEVPVGRTVVKVLADPTQLIIGIRAEDPDPEGIVSFTVQRDADLDEEDHLLVVLDPFLDGRSGVVFGVNPRGARLDALVAERGGGLNRRWDAVWEVATARGPWGWSAEIRIPVRSLSFDPGLDRWGFNVQRRVQRLQEVSRWASPTRDIRVYQTSRAGTLEGLPDFRLGLGLSVRPAFTGGGGKPAPGAAMDGEAEPSLDVTQRLGANLLASLTVNTDFAQTDVDARQTNLTRFPLFFPEKRSFFLEGADIFDFGLGLGREFIPFFTRRIGLVEGREVPIVAGGKLNGRVGETNLGALVVRTDDVSGLVPAATVGVVRVSRNVLTESSAGVLATFGDPVGREGSWTAGADFTYQTSRLAGDKNFLVGVWGLRMARKGLEGERTAVGLKVDYPNDLWDVALTYRRVGDAFQPSLGFVPRPGIHDLFVKGEFKPRPGWRLVRQMFFMLLVSPVFDLDGRLESYEVVMAPVNWLFESGDRFGFGVVSTGDRPPEPFEIAEEVTIPAGSYDWLRWGFDVQTAAKRRLSARLNGWFGGFYGGTLHQLKAEGSWTPIGAFTLEFSGERDIGHLPQGDFTKDLARVRVRLNLSPDVELASFVQYDNESETLGSNTRFRWTFHPQGELFLVYNHNLREEHPGLSFDSNELLLKIQYEFRH